MNLITRLNSFILFIAALLLLGAMVSGSVSAQEETYPPCEGGTQINISADMEAPIERVLCVDDDAVSFWILLDVHGWAKLSGLDLKDDTVLTLGEEGLIVTTWNDADDYVSVLFSDEWAYTHAICGNRIPKLDDCTFPDIFDRVDGIEHGCDGPLFLDSAQTITPYLCIEDGAVAMSFLQDEETMRGFEMGFASDAFSFHHIDGNLFLNRYDETGQHFALHVIGGDNGEFYALVCSDYGDAYMGDIIGVDAEAVCPDRPDNN